MSINKLLVVLLISKYGLASAQPLTPQSADLGTASETHIAIADLSDPAAPGKTFLAATIMDAPVQKLCSVIMDYSAYAQFMPNTDATRVVSSSGDYTVIEMTLGLPLGKPKSSD